MTDNVQNAQSVGLPDERPPSNIVGPLAWLRNNLFNSWYNAILTVLVLGLLATAVPPFVNWLLIRAHGFDAASTVCRQDAGGACWGFISEKLRFIMFGMFPWDEQWRPLVTICVIIALLVVSCDRRFWKPWLGLVWAAGLALHLFASGVLGVAYLYAFEHVFHRANFRLGICLSIVHTAVEWAVVSLVAQAHPLAPEIARLFTPGESAFLGFAFVHMIYGAIVGSLAAPGRATLADALFEGEGEP